MGGENSTDINMPGDLNLNALIRNHLGGEFSQLIRASMHTVKDTRILVVESLRASQPVFFRRDKDEVFYVRSGPSTAVLSPSELIAYLKSR